MRSLRLPGLFPARLLLASSPLLLVLRWMLGMPRHEAKLTLTGCEGLLALRTGVPPLVHLPWNISDRMIVADDDANELAVAWEGLPPPWEVHHWAAQEIVQLWAQHAWPGITMGNGLATRLLQLHAMGGVAADATSTPCAHQGESEFISAWAGWHSAEVHLVLVKGPSQQLMETTLASTPGHPFLAFALQRIATIRRSSSSFTAAWDAFVAENAACADLVQRQTRVYEFDEWRENVAAWSAGGAIDPRDCGAAREAERQAARKAAKEAALASRATTGSHESEQPSDEWKRWAKEWASANMRNDRREAQRIINEVAASATEPGQSFDPSVQVTAVRRLVDMVRDA